MVVALGACSKEILTIKKPRILIFAEGVSSYKSFSEPTIDDPIAEIDLGDVPVYGSKTAVFRIENDTAQKLLVTEMVFDEREGDVWADPAWSTSPAEFGYSRPAPFDVSSIDKLYVLVRFSPSAEGEASATVGLISNAGNLADHELGPRTQLRVVANGIFAGAPELELEYNGITAPDASDTCADGLCTVADGRAFDFGNIGLNMQGTARLLIRNAAACQADPNLIGIDTCSSCALRIDKNPDHFNLGIGFKEGTNDDGLFSFVGSTAVPFEILQRDVDCRSEGELKILLSFNAPGEESEHETVLVIESNDPDRPAVEIPVRASSRNAPVAVCKLREFDPDDPSAPYSDEAGLEPLERVYLDARDSYDPSVGPPEDPASHQLADYRYEVVSAPSGVNPGDYQWQGQGLPLASFWLPIAGEYTVRCIVTNDAGIESGDTAESRVTFTVIPGSALHIQLVWDHPSNDQDLHLLYLTQSQTICDDNWDCYFANCKERNSEPVHWFTNVPAGEGPNPRLDRDDTNGLGPENINIDSPGEGTYRVMVHYWGSGGSSGTAPTVNTIRIYLNGILRFDQQRTLRAKNDLWTVADVFWATDGTDTGTGTVSVYPSSDPLQVGEVRQLTTSNCSSASESF